MYKIIGADGREYGPISAEQLKQWIAEGRLNGNSKVLMEGTTEWKTLSQFPELAGAIPSQPPPPVGQPQPFAVPAGTPLDSSSAAQMVSGPAVGLIVTGGLALLGNIAGLLFSLFGASLIAMQGAQNEALTAMMQGTMGIVSAVLGLLTSGVVILGGVKMMKLQAYTLAMVASIIAMIPCFTGVCCLIGLPVGIWALVILNKPEVKSSFH